MDGEWEGKGSCFLGFASILLYKFHFVNIHCAVCLGFVHFPVVVIPQKFT